MRDTSPEMERKYRELLLQRSGAERLKMGCSMFATARALALAAAREEGPSASSARLRQQLFLRLYGADFGTEERGRIAMRFLQSEEESPSPAPVRQVPIDWDDLEIALTFNADEMSCYLDVRTGKVEMVPAGRLRDDDWPPDQEIDAGLARGHLIHVEPLGSSVEYGWMAAFASSARDARLRDKLEVALDGRGAFRRFKNVLASYAAERESWFAFRDVRLRETVREWLAERGIEPTASQARGHPTEDSG
jgi:hypothetical protein